MGKTWSNESEDFGFRETEDSCLSCGKLRFTESKVPGLCVDCVLGVDYEQPGPCVACGNYGFIESSMFSDICKDCLGESDTLED